MAACFGTTMKTKMAGYLAILIEVNTDGGPIEYTRVQRLVSERFGASPNTRCQWTRRLRALLEEFNRRPDYKGRKFTLEKGTPKLLPARGEQDVWELLTSACRERNDAVLLALEQGRRYFPDLYVSRVETEGEFESFLNSKKQLFCLVAASGRGKTSLFCRLAHKSRHPSLLFLGGQYGDPVFAFPGTIDSTLAQVFQGTSEDSTDQINLDRVSEIAVQNDDVCLVFLDALNDFPNPSSVLEGLSRWAVDRGRRLGGIRVCLSCREETWRHLVREKQVFLPGGLLYTSRVAAVSNVTGPLDQGPCVGMPKFTDEELRSAAKMYGNAYRTKGQLSEQAREACRDPFILQLTFETFSEQDLPSDVFGTKLFDAYWKHVTGIETGPRRYFLENFANYLVSGHAKSVSEETLRSLEWYQPETLRELLDLNILIRIQTLERYSESVGFRHDRLLEYVLARRLYRNRQDILENPGDYMADSESYAPTLSAMRWFLGMLAGNERRRFCERIAVTGQDGLRVVGEVLGDLAQVDDEDVELIRNVILADAPLKGAWVCLGPLVRHRPRECLDLLEEVILSEEDDLLSDSSLSDVALLSHTLLRILEELPQASETVEKWFGGSVAGLRVAATWPHLHHMFLTDRDAALDLLSRTLRAGDSHVRREAALCLPEAFEHDPRTAIVLCTQAAADPDKWVRSRAVNAALTYVSEDLTRFSEFEAWRDRNRTELRHSLASFCGQSLLSTTGEIWETVVKLSKDPEESVRIALFEALGERLLYRGGLDTAYELPEVLELLRAEVVDSSRELRQRLASKHRIWAAQPIKDASRRWLRDGEGTLRHFAALVMSRSPGEVGIASWERLSRDRCPDVRSTCSTVMWNPEVGPFNQRFGVLEGMAEDKVSSVRRDAFGAAVLLLDEEPDRAMGFLNRVKSSDLSWTDVLHINQVLCDFFLMTKGKGQILAELLNSGSPQVQRLLVYSCALALPLERPMYRDADACMRVFKAGPWQAQALLINALCSTCAITTARWQVDELVSLLKYASSASCATVRAELAEGLCYVIAGHQEARGHLWPIVEVLREDQDWWVQFILAVSVSSSPDAETTPSLLHALPGEAMALLRSLSTSSRDWAVRGAACFSAARLPSKDRSRFFSHMASDSHPFVEKWIRRLRKRETDESDACELFAEVFCRDLATFEAELAYDLPVNFREAPEEGCALVEPMLKFSRQGTLKMLETWATSDDETLVTVAKCLLQNISRKRVRS